MTVTSHSLVDECPYGSRLRVSFRLRLSEEELCAIVLAIRAQIDVTAESCEGSPNSLVAQAHPELAGDD